MESKSHSFGSRSPINRPAIPARPTYSNLTTYSGMKQAGYQKVTGPGTSVVNSIRVITNIG